MFASRRLQRLHHRAGLLLDAQPDQAARLAADAMFHLNRLAKHYYGTALIYAAKNVFVQHLYETGCCANVVLHIQKLTCWECGGEGEDEYGDLCWKCGGDGVYREIQLYRFAFDVDGQRYLWHQPARLVSWPVTLTEEEPGAYEVREPPTEDVKHRRRAELYLLIVAEWLRRQGKAVPGLPLEAQEERAFS